MYSNTTGMLMVATPKKTRKSVQQLPMRLTIRLSTYYISLYRFQHKVEHDGDQEADGEAGQAIPGEVLEVIGQKIAQASGDQDQHQVPGQRINGHRGDGLFTQGRAVALLNQSGAHIIRKLGKVFDKLCIALYGAQFNQGNTAEDTSQDTDGSAGHAQVIGGFPAQSAQGITQSRGCTVAALETGGDQHPKSGIQVRRKNAQDQHRKNDGEAVLETPADVAQAVIAADPVEVLLDAALGEVKASQAKGDEHSDNEHTGIRTSLTGELDQLQAVLACDQGQETGQQADRDKEALQDFNLLAQELCNE